MAGQQRDPPGLGVLGPPCLLGCACHPKQLRDTAWLGWGRTKIRGDFPVPSPEAEALPLGECPLPAPREQA